MPRFSIASPTNLSGSLSDSAHSVPSRTASSYKPLRTFDLDKERSYKQQFSDMYFLRLTKIKPAVEEIAAVEWKDTVIAGEKAKRVDRVLDVRQGELCWMAGTVYMDMSMKPNILEDVSKDVCVNLNFPAWESHGTSRLTENHSVGCLHPYLYRNTTPKMIQIV